ncbi:cupin domain-containing protein [Pontiellaceae bacterium B12227]|nr:cupin domain-containing protein [Pontiellaceae bacterium B12227]
MSDFINRPLDLKNEISYADGAVISKILLKKEVGNITLFSFDKGQGLSEHTSPYDAVVQVVEGKGSFIVDGEMKTVEEGGMIIMPANIPHDVQAAEQPFKMLLTMIRSEQ